MNEPQIQEVEITAENLRGLLMGMSEEDAIQAMQELANAHGLAIATLPVPEGVDKRLFVREVMAKMEKVTGIKAEDATHGPVDGPVEVLSKMLRQKAEIEKANIQHCEHNSRASLALQIVGISLNMDKDIECQPDSFKKLFDTSCNTLRDVMTGTPVE